MTLPRCITKTAASSSDDHWVTPGEAKDGTAEPDSRVLYL